MLRKNERAARLAEHFSGLHSLLDTAAMEKKLDSSLHGDKGRKSSKKKRSKSDRDSKQKRKTDKRFSKPVLDSAENIFHIEFSALHSYGLAAHSRVMFCDASTGSSSR